MTIYTCNAYLLTKTDLLKWIDSLLVNLLTEYHSRDILVNGRSRNTNNKVNKEKIPGQHYSSCPETNGNEIM